MGPRDSFGDALRTIRSACSELFRSGARQLEPDRQPGDREIRPTAPTPLSHRARGPAGSQTVATQWSRPPTPPMPDNSTVHEPHALLRTLAAAMVGLARGTSVHVWVRDDGCGVDEPTREWIFEPFFTTEPVGQGTGSGLAVAH